MTWTDALGNASNLLIAVSYLVTNRFWLQVLAIAGLAAGAVNVYAANSGSLWAAIGWSLVFLLINALQLTRLACELRFPRSRRTSKSSRTIHGRRAVAQRRARRSADVSARAGHAPAHADAQHGQRGGRR